MQFRYTLVLMATLSGCAVAPPTIDMPVLVYGTVQKPDWTHWIRDYCNSGKPVDFDHLDCAQLGGEINAATLTDARIVNGSPIRKRLKIAFVGHGLGPGYTKRMHMVLVPSPDDFRAATGISYFVGDRDNYDAKAKCIENHGYSHVDFSDCPDPEFHETQSGCIGVPEYLAHYAK